MALSSTQLDAASSVAGTFVYTPSFGAVLNAGSQTLLATFTPTDTTDYTTKTASVEITVKKATPTIKWAAPAAIIYGTPLNAIQLNATSTTAGTFVYNHDSGVVLRPGTHSLLATFTPTDTVDYTTAKDTVSLAVGRPGSPITWATPAAITYGTALGLTQLDATSSEIGTFVYTPSSGTVLKAGSQTLSVTFTPAESSLYTDATATVTLTVNKATPVISWATPAAITYGTALGAAQLDATSSVAGTFVYTPAAGTVLKAGVQTLSVTFTPTDSIDYTTATSTVSITVKQASPVIGWATPAAITYGTALGAAQLDATSSVAGTFVYTPAAGNVLKAGVQTLSVTFTPTDSVDYTTATSTVSITVKQASPVISWATPAAITYGTALGAAQLDATSSLAGTFVYTPAAGTVLKAGVQILSVTFTPTDSIDYTTATSTVSITVKHASPVISWATPAAITYGTALGAAQLDATSSVAGTFVYTPAAGTVLKAGVQILSVTFTPTDSIDYTTATSTVSITVNTAATPVINWATPAAITYGTALSAAQLNATSSVAGTFVYTPAAGTVLKAGVQTLSVTFTPTDSVDYTTATSTVSITVKQASPVIGWANPAAITYGTALGAAQLDATSSVAGTFVYTPAAGTVLKAGVQILSVTFTPTDSIDYTTATSSISITVKAATPVINWATPAAITYGTALSATQLDATSSVAGTFVYSPAAGAVLAVGSQTLSVTLTPTDTTDYTTAAQTVTLTVSAGTATLSISATSVGFGNVALNTPATQDVTLSSTGTAPVTVNSGTVTGTSFSLSAPALPATLTPGQTLTLAVQFDPTSTGAATGQLTITSTSSTNGTALIPLTGTGIAASYSVDLSWDAPSSSPDPVAGYNVYRSPSGSSMYQLLNSTVDSQVTYVDATVEDGQTYDYIVESVDSSGNQSVPTSPIAVTIP
jgi:hypothetical protein